MLGIAFILATASTALALTGLNGFGATTYASGYPVGAPAGIAFINSTMYTTDPTDGGLYATAAAGTLARVGTIPGAPTGLAAFGTSLFAIQSATNTIVQVDTATAAVLASLGSSVGGLRLNGIAADPVNGDLFLSAAEGYVQVIRAPYRVGPSLLTQLVGSPATFGIAVASDHSAYVAVEGGGVSGVRQVDQPSLAQGPVGPSFAGARGIGVIPGYLFVNGADGTIRKIVIPGVGTGPDVPSALIGGAAGSFATIGFDQCFYASQGTAVIRLANANLTCDLATAGPPPLPPAIRLVRLSTQAPLIGNGDQTFSAQISNVSPADGITVTFTVTRGASSTTYARVTDATGTATFGYSAATPGVDSITASAVLNSSTTLTAAPFSLSWPRALDTVKPVITYTVTGNHNPNRPAPNAPVFACPNPLLGTPGSEEFCGWYTSPPTVHFVVARGVGGTTDPVYSCPDFTLTVSSPLTGTPVTCTAQNGDGASTALKVVLQAVLSAPTIEPSASTPAGPFTGAQPTNQDVTVSFACATDPNLGPAGLSFCGPTQIVTAEGPQTVSGYVLDVAGTRRDASFGPFIIDRTPPVVTVASMKTASGAAYTPGTPTTENVVVTFACTDNLDPHPTCPAPVTVTAGPNVTVSASDWAGNSKSYTFGGINIDRTGPTVSSAITPPPGVGGSNAPGVTVSVTASDPSGVASITYSATGAQPISSTTLASIGGPPTFSVQIVLNAAGATTITYTAKDVLGNTSTSGTVTVTIASVERSTLTITSPPILPKGATVVSATLAAPDGAPIVGRTVTFSAGTATATGVTNANGVATATLALKKGVYLLTAAFAGDTWFGASSATATLAVIHGGTDHDNGDGGSGHDRTTDERPAATEQGAGTD